MEKIDEQLNNLAFVEAPNGMHILIMQKVNYQKMKPVIFLSFSFLVLSFLASIWYINVKLIDAEFIDMMQDFFGVFNFSFDYINTMLGSFFEIVSPILLSYSILSLFGVAYLARKITFYSFTRV